MSAAKNAPDVARLLRAAVDQAAVGASWSKDRIAPLMQSIGELTKIEGLSPADIRRRVALVAKLAMLGIIATDEMGADFEVVRDEAGSQLAAFEGSEK